MAVPETRQVGGVPEGQRPGSHGTAARADCSSKGRDGGTPDSGLDGAEFLRWAHTCVAALEQARAEIDGLNVFPVPDSDTGRNLLATMRAAIAEADASAREAVGGAGGEPGAGTTGNPVGGVAAAALTAGAEGPAGRAALDTAGGASGELMGVVGAEDPVGSTAGEPVGGVTAARQLGRVADEPGGGAPGEIAGAEDFAGGAAENPVGRRFGAGADGRPVVMAGEQAGRALRNDGGGASGATTSSACAEEAAGDVHRYAVAMAHGATVGARGNSGIILSQVLRGVAEATGDGGLTGATYRRALARAAQLVRGSLSEPVEGTILTVLDRASAAAQECAGSGLGEVARAAAAGAARALDETRDQLAVLRAAGVVDAGARGLLVLLDAMVAVVTGETPVRRAYPAAADTPLEYHRGSAPAPARYEVMFRIPEGEEAGAARLRSRLAVLGDSVVVAADGAGGWAVHVHCADAGAAVEAGMAVGRVRNIRIEYLAVAPRDLVAGEIALDGEVPAAGSGARCATGGGPVAGTSGGGLSAGGTGDRSAAGTHTDGAGAPGVAHGGNPGDTGAPVGLGRAGVVDRGVPGGAAESSEAAGNGGGRAADGLMAGTGGGASAGRIGDRTAAVVSAGGDSAVAPGRGAGDPGAAVGVGGAGVVDRGILAVAAGAGAAELFEAAGAVVLGAEPALESAALLAAIRRMPHREVLVLPNGALPAHELVAVGAAARDAHRDVLLLPSASMVQGLAALAVHDRARIAVDDAFAMSEAAAGTRWGALRRAEGRALTMVGTCAPGDGLGLVGHDVVVIDRDTRAAGYTLLDRMLGLGGELVTLLVGADAPEGLADDLAGHIAAEFPGVEVAVYSGGQRADLIQLGVE